jgi:hypothetical protein
MRSFFRDPLPLCVSHFTVRIYVVVSGPLRNIIILVHSCCKRFRPLAEASYKHVQRSIPVFSRRDTPNVVPFPRSLDATHRKDHIVSEVITHVKFVCVKI